MFVISASVFGEVFGGIETPKSSRRWRISEAYESSSSVASLSIEEGIEDMFVIDLPLFCVFLCGDFRLSRSHRNFQCLHSFARKSALLSIKRKSIKEIFICAWYCAFFP